MSLKRKRGGEAVPNGNSNHVPWPSAGTRTFSTGKAARDALAGGSPSSLVAFHQQLYTPYSQLPLPITHQSIILLQHYIDLSPNCEEIFEAWAGGDKNRNAQLVEAATRLLTLIIQLITPLPFFRQTLSNLVKRVTSASNPVGALLNKAIQSPKRDEQQHALCLAAACIHADPPDAAALHGMSGRLAARVWGCLVEGGSVRAMGRMLHVRKRNKDGVADYGTADPLDRQDIRHAILHLILPLFPLPAFQSSCRPLIKGLHAHLDNDPPITIVRVFTALWKAIILPAPGMGRRATLALLDEKAIEYLIGLLNRHDTDLSVGKTVGELAMGLLEAVTTVPGKGVCFQDEGWYPRQQKEDDLLRDEDERSMRRDESRQGLHNRILANVVRNLGARAVDETGRIGEWMLKVFAACPELVAGFWPYSALHVDPRLSARWIAAMSFIGQVISLPSPPIETFHDMASGIGSPSVDSLRTVAPSLETIIESIIPSPLMLKHIQKGLAHPDALVKHITAQTLARAFEKLTAVNQRLEELEALANSRPGPSENVWARCRRELEIEARRRVPDITTIITFAQSSAALVRPPPGAGEDWEPEATLVAKSDMLTEAALRLFKGYQVALPGIAREIKFDIGRLLVSGSTRKQEKKLKKEEKREGSTAGDTVSVMSSVGTVGTAGMGGGYGADRGDTEGWQALNQLHVVSLLLQSQGWQWWNKASGSQYTYLYHVLLLGFTSKHAYIIQYTTDLLERMLEPSLLFQHHPIELVEWLEALPVLHGQHINTERRARLFTQQLYLLDFLDDCFRRATKTPYKYIEDLTALWPEFTASKARALPSPVIMAVIEQLRAKLLGEHISTDAAGVVLCYLRRVFLALAGKSEPALLDALVKRIRDAVEEAKAKGQKRKGLGVIVSHMEFERYLSSPRDKGDIPLVIDNEGETRLEDDEEFAERSPHWSMLNHCTADTFWPSPARLREKKVDENTLLANQSDDRLEIICHSAARLLHSLLSIDEEVDIPRLLWIIRSCILVTRDPINKRNLKRVMFTTEYIKKTFLREASLSWNLKMAMTELANVLSVDDENDQEIAKAYCEALIDNMLKGSNKGGSVSSKMDKIEPWNRFLSSGQACTLFDHFIEGLSQIAEPRLRKYSFPSEDFLRQLKDPLFVIARLEKTLPMGIYSALEPITRLLPNEPLSKRQSVAISMSTVELLLEAAVGQGRKSGARPVVDVLENLPNAARNIIDCFKRKPELATDPVLFEAFSRVLDIPNIESVIPEVIRRAVDSAFEFISKPISKHQPGISRMRSMPEAKKQAISEEHRLRSVAIDILTKAAILETATPVLQMGLTEPSISDYSPSFATLTSELLQLEKPELDRSLKRLLELGLTFLTKALSTPGRRTSQESNVLTVLEMSLPKYPADRAGQLDHLLVERYVTTVIQDHLSFPYTGLGLATALLRCSEPKASFVRQSLTLIFASTSFRSLTSSSEHLQGICELLAVLFHASPYASCQPNFIEPLLPIYAGTLSVPNQELLGIFQLFERFRHTSVLSLFRVWSPIGGVVKTQKRLLDALLALEPKKVFDSCCHFPLRRKLTSSLRAGGSTSELMDREERQCYDPSFVLPLLAATMHEQLSGLDWVEVLRSNVLGLVVTALASRDGHIRQLAAHCLNRAHQKIIASAFHERAQLLLILELIRHAIPNTTTDEVDHGVQTAWTPPRLPTLTTLFLAYCLRSLANPSHFLYPLCMRFLLQRPIFDMYDIPMLFGMLYASGDQYKRERTWMLRLLKDGVRNSQDWRILTRRRTTSLLMTVYSSSLDPNYRALILQAFLAFAAIPAGSVGMAQGDQFISWLYTQWVSSAEHQDDLDSRGIKHNKSTEKSTYLAILEKIVINLVAREHSRNASNAKEPSSDSITPAHRADGHLGWAIQAETLIILALDECDRIPQLELLARIAFRLSTLPPPAYCAEKLLPPILKTFTSIRQVHLDREAQATKLIAPSTIGEEQLEPEFGNALELLFRISLELRQEDVTWGAKMAVVENARLLQLSQGDLRIWVEQERVLAERESLGQLVPR